jgi:hypothetical protein
MRSIRDMPVAIRAAIVAEAVSQDGKVVLRGAEMEYRRDAANALGDQANARYQRAAENPFADWEIEDQTGEDDEPLPTEDTDLPTNENPDPAERGQNSEAMNKLRAMALGNNELPAEQSDGETESTPDADNGSVDVYARQWEYLTDES